MEREEVIRMLLDEKIPADLVKVCGDVYSSLKIRPAYTWDIEQSAHLSPTMAWNPARQKMETAIFLLERRDLIERTDQGRYQLKE